VYQNQFQDPTNWVVVNDLHKSILEGGSFQAVLLPVKDLLLTLGLEYNREKLESTKFNTVRRDWFSVFLQSEFESLFRLNSSTIEWRIVPAIRVDKYSDTQAHFSPKLGFLIHTIGSRNLGIRSNIGSSFRMPSFNDLYWPADDWSKGNVNLVSETSRNFDLGCFFQRSAINSFKFEFSYFKNSISDFINWSPSDELNAFGFQVWQPQNIGRTNISGFEIGSNFWFLNNLFNFSMGHTYLLAKNKTANNGENFILYRPKTKFDLSGGFNFKQLYLNINYGYVGKRFTQSDNSTSLPAYSLVNGSVRFLFNFAGVKLNTKFQILNLFDKSIYAIQGYPLPGRQFRISLGVEY
jgi:outer membrane cobalamin receptor